MYIRSQVGVGLASQGGKRYIRLLKCLRVGSVGFFENGQILTRVMMVEEGLFSHGLRWTGAHLVSFRRRDVSVMGCITHGWVRCWVVG